MDKFKLRVATENDVELIYNWANDEECRKNSLNTDKIPYENHIKWYNQKLIDPFSYIYILQYNGQDVGQIRIDISDNIGLISYMIDCKYRGKGFGKMIITMAENEVKGKVSYLRAIVKYANMPSKNIFESLGYSKELDEEYIIYVKRLN